MLTSFCFHVMQKKDGRKTARRSEPKRKKGESEKGKLHSGSFTKKTLMELNFIVMAGSYDLHTEFLRHNRTLWNAVC